LEEKKDSDEIFENTVKMYIDALEIYDHFWDFVTEKKILTNTVLAKENKSKEEFLNLIDAYQKDLDAFYEKNIKNLRIPFFDGVKKEMSAYYFSMNELLKIMKEDAINTNTKKIEDLEALKKLEIFSQEFLTRQQNNEFKKWREETVKQYVYLYIEKTFDAYHLYKKAYSFAKKNKLLEITKVWGNDYPMKELKID